MFWVRLWRRWLGVMVSVPWLRRFRCYCGEMVNVTVFGVSKFEALLDSPVLN